MRAAIVCVLVILAGCVSVPEGVEPVKNFKLERYLGQWYEVARLDHSFERGMQQVTAQYSLHDEGGVRVINRGFDTGSDSWDEAEGRAYFVDGSDTGYLKVSFFGPFYGAYIIFDLGEDYQYSLVTSSDKSYLWLLSRTPEIDAALQAKLINRMAELGFDTEALIFVDQSKAVKNTRETKGEL
ncbi:Outer membrane lipoprotein Blc [Sinobacterium norvegicum]|uniref:Outer membrane lipoprotein Blc n=1 Tax=Sinobacterium norvegicum TaxID=1641715 RepID=A0ABM9AG12_9GAMM|nr:lipocalin family protein [Sinobacterium norvegicum]CAH0992150.1 Outer membrane lipoprotein Blc [Sinobacterium norvegicum]